MKIHNVVVGDKEDYSLSELLTVMMVIETLGAILGEFTESAGGFIFEGFLAGLFGGKSVQIEKPEDLPEEDGSAEVIAEPKGLNENEEADDADQAGKPITDVVLDTPQGLRHYSLKLLGPSTAVKGSFENMVKHFMSFDHVIYLDARVTDGRTRMKFSEFEITVEKFLEVFYEPFQAFASTVVPAADVAEAKKIMSDVADGLGTLEMVQFNGRPVLLRDLENLGIEVADGYETGRQIYLADKPDTLLSVLGSIEKVQQLPDPDTITVDEDGMLSIGDIPLTRGKKINNRSLNTVKRIVGKVKARAAKMLPIKIQYSAEAFEKSKKAVTYFGTKNKFEQVKRQISELSAMSKSGVGEQELSSKRREVIKTLQALPAYEGKLQFDFTPGQVEKIASHKVIGPAEGLVVGGNTLKKIWLQYGDKLRNTIEPVYRNLNEFTGNINSYFLSPAEGSGLGRLQHGEKAISDAKELHTATDKVVKGIGDPSTAKMDALERAAEFNLRSIDAQGRSLAETKTKKNK